MSDTKSFSPQVPILNLPEDAEILLEFTNETLNYLISAENSLLTLENIPDDKDALENIFKVFYTIMGLSEFLQLQDIHILAQKLQQLLDMLRKKNLVWDENIYLLLSRSINDLKELLALLDEQTRNHGKLKAPYFDITETLREISNSLSGQKVSGESLAIKARTDVSAVASKFSGLEHLVSQSGEEVKISKEILQKLLQDFKNALTNLAQPQDKLLQRQSELVREREFALRLNQQSQNIARAKSDFLASMAHEIRTLINTILGFSDLLMKSSLDKKQQEHLNAVVASGRMLSEIVNNILEFSKIEQGKIVLESINFNLMKLVEEVVALMKAKANAKSLNFKFDIDKNLSVSLTGDPTRIKQILINLIDNAIKFTEKGQIALVVLQENMATSLQKSAGAGVRFIRFQVEDTGIGIPEDKRENIFESFTQADSTITRRFGGSGLGLAICKSYIEAMGGRIWVKPKIGGGSQFVFNIKLKESIKPEEQKGKNLSASKEKEIPLENSCKGLKVLVVEDSIPNQELLKAYFDILGCEGAFATNGEAAIEKIKNTSYDICFMDLQLPLMGGFDVSQTIRRQLNRHFPILALTATSMKDKKEQYLKAGMTGYLEKPFDIVQLQQKILQYAKGKDGVSS